MSEVPRDQKKDMARQRLKDNLERPILDAMAEGLTSKEIKAIMDEILKKIG